jgi:signal peptidase I
MFKRFWLWYKRPHKSTIEQYIESIIILVPLAFFIRTFFYGLYRVPTGSMETTMLVGEMFFADKLSFWFRTPHRGEIIAFNDPVYKYSKNYFVNWCQRYVYGPSNWTKRVIGIPGDHVQGRIENGHPVIYLNDQRLDEPYVNTYPLLEVWKKRCPNAQDIYLMQYGKFDMSNIPEPRSYDPSKAYDKQPFYRIDPTRIVVVNGKQQIRMPATPLRENEDEFDVYLKDGEYWVIGDNRLGSWDSRGWGVLKENLIHGRIVFRIFSVDSGEPWLIWHLLRHPIDFWKRVRGGRCLEVVR